MPSNLKVDDFDFDLPPDAVAQRPVVPRDAARLLDVDGTVADRVVRDLPSLLCPGDVMVFNDTLVIPARLKGKRGEAGIEATLLKEISPGRWQALARPVRRLRPGHRIRFAADFSAEVEAKGEAGEVVLAFDRQGTALMAALDANGAMPLPPYIKRTGPDDVRDRIDYQTVFAARPGAIAAPTAGLHFTPELLAAIDDRGVRRATVTLHVGAGTFLPVKADRIEDHVMHPEWGEIGKAAAAGINAARAHGGRVVAVGTTSLRLLETAADHDGRIRPFAGETLLFITPGYRFRVVDLLLTNFHLPRSTLFMLVCAFSGTARMKEAYHHAVAAGYRFYSYGDCCLLRRSTKP
jgi:S-adenosylmethionine:tRNA ribosyltransferase-isomerase